MASVERERLKRAFGKKGIIALLGLVAGLILLVLPTPKEEQTPLPESGVMTSAEYCAMLEQKAERLICELPEVDDCVVVITLERGYRHVYASDMHVNEYSDGRGRRRGLQKRVVRDSLSDNRADVRSVRR